MAPPGPNEKSRLKGTDLVHADDELHGVEVAPSISVSTSRCCCCTWCTLLADYAQSSGILSLQMPMIVWPQVVLTHIIPKTTCILDTHRL